MRSTRPWKRSSVALDRDLRGSLDLARGDRAPRRRQQRQRDQHSEPSRDSPGLNASSHHTLLVAVPSKPRGHNPTSWSPARRQTSPRSASPGCAATSANAQLSTGCLSSSPPASRWSSSAPTEPARRPSCGSSRRCCARAAARRGCSAASCPARPGGCAGGSATWATSRSSTATSAGARTSPSTLACTGSAARRPRRGSRSCSSRSGCSGAPTSGSSSSRPGCASGWRSAAACCTSRELLLLDEPDSNLDAEGRELARQLIGPGDGRTRVVVTHDPERHLADADRVLRLGIGAESSVEAAA